MTDRPCTLILHSDSSKPLNVQEIKTALEKGNDQEKIDAMKQTIHMLLNGGSAAQLLVPVIRFITPCKNHTIKKLLLIFWELIDKQDPTVRSTLLLICNALLRDLNYPNEYVRGSTLRFLCKLQDQELLQPLIEAVRANFEHRHAYVRRNAVLAIYSIVKDFPQLIPDAGEMVLEAFHKESDPSCKRNMFIMLFAHSRDKMIEYLHSVLDQVENFGEMNQLIIIEIVRVRPAERGKYLRCVFTLLSSHSPAVQYEAAHTLASLSAAPTAIKAVASAYINLLVKESDNNVKMIVLDRLIELKKKHLKILQKLAMDVLRALASPNMQIRSKVLNLALELVTPTNIQEVMLLFKKEMNRTQVEGFEDANEYRRLLVKAIHGCAVRFPDVAHDVVHVLMDFIGDDDENSSTDIVEFVREVVQTYPSTRDPLLGKLIQSIDQIKSSKVFRSALWILGEYCDTFESIDTAISGIRSVLGELPLSTDAPSSTETTTTTTSAAAPAPAAVAYSGPRVLADGTYATSTALEVGAAAASSETSISMRKSALPPLRHLLVVSKDFFLASVLATTLSKMTLRYKSLLGQQQDNNEALPAAYLKVHAWTLLCLTSVLRFMESQSLGELDEDSYERVCLCFNLVADMESETASKAQEIYLNSSRQSFAQYLSQVQEQKNSNSTDHKEQDEVQAQVDDLIKIRQLKPQKGVAKTDIEGEDDESDLQRATGHVDKEDYTEKLSRIVQLTGFSDPIYAEADINVRQYDVTLDITIFNQTKDTLQNLCLELATLGDLKLVERPQNYTIGPYSKKNIKSHVKVSSTETGVIFGSIVYDTGSSTEKSVILNEIRIDVLDYISPAYTDDASFRKMWSEFEWENKVLVHTSMTDLNEYLNHIQKSTNMNCLTPLSSLKGDCGFLSANLHARSVFGEDALANVSIEQGPGGKISGTVKIRSKTQGIAVSLGKKVEACSSPSF